MYIYLPIIPLFGSIDIFKSSLSISDHWNEIGLLDWFSSYEW